tara:strand:+ start:366 stop:548 length:183 start_codon:yes stop_codon:yes gene_type:complete
MKNPTKREQQLIDQAVRLQDQLNAAIQLSKDMEEAYDKLANKYDLVRQSHHMTTQILSHN